MKVMASTEDVTFHINPFGSENDYGTDVLMTVTACGKPIRRYYTQKLNISSAPAWLKVNG